VTDSVKVGATLRTGEVVILTVWVGDGLAVFCLTGPYCWVTDDSDFWTKICEFGVDDE
jgi:hypothetical protein